MLTARLSFRIALAMAAGQVVLASSPPARALDPDKRLSECSVRTWSVSDGLPSAWVRALAQTPDGYLWIGTQAGLVRHGGGDLQPLPPTRAFEQAGDVVQLAVAGDGRLWLTPDRGTPVCLRDDEYQSCLPAGQALPPDARVLTIQPDTAAGASGAWLATSAGIYRFDGARLTLIHRPPQWGSAPLAALVPAGDSLWLGTASGLWVARGPDVSPADGAGFGPGPISVLLQTASGHRWAAGAGRLARVDGAADVVLGEADGLKRSQATSVLEDRHGNVWMGTRAGLVRYQAGRGITMFTRSDGLPEDDISALLEDREGSLWVGTRGGGLAQFSDRTLSTAHGPPSLRDRWVYAVAEAPDGAVWAGSMMGLTRWKDGKEHTYDQADGLPGGGVLTVWPAPGGEVWAGGERGLARWRQGKIDQPLPVKVPVTALYVDDRGILWIGGPELLARYDGHTFTRLTVAPDETEPMGEIRGMQHDDQGVLWVSGNGRLYRLDGERLQRDRTPGAPLFGRVRSLNRDRDGTLWLGSYDGLARRSGGAWRIEVAPPGVALTDLFQVLPDDRGQLWIGAARGLFRLDKRALDGGEAGPVLSFETTDRRREVAATRSRQPGAWKGAGGRLWFASARGVISVDPDRVPVSPLPPPVRIEQALVDGHPARLRQANRFPPGSGALEFRYAAITLLEPHKAQHRYRLEGFDAAWVEAGTRRAAYYTNIPPGNYRFRVQGRNADGVWNLEGDSLALSLAPHFRQTPWFYGLLVLTAAGLGLAFYRMRVAQLHGRYAATAAERNRLGRELHDNLLQGMSAALIQLKALRKRFVPDGEPGAPQEVAGEIEEIEQVLAANVEETRRSIWELREPRSEPATLAAALEQLIGRMRRPGVDLRLVVDGAHAPLPAHVTRELLRIAQEAIANALDHARPTRIEVTLRQRDGSPSLVVRDDGAGFDPAQAPGAAAGHFGLTGMRERAAALGTFTLESQPGAGTRIEVTLSAPPRTHESEEPSHE